MQSPEAGPSRPRGPHPSHPPTPQIRHLRPPAPPAPERAAQRTLPTKVLQGAATRRTEATRAGFARDTIFVTRKTKLGALIGRARGLVVDEGYTHLTLYALSAAIPHALLLLHALMDVLPFPSGPGGMWYEIVTDSVECVDEVGADGANENETNSEHSDFAGLGAMEEDAPELVTRLKSSIRIDLHIAPRGRSVHPPPPPKRAGSRLARPSAKARKASKARAKGAGVSVGAGDGPGGDEEHMMNG